MVQTDFRNLRLIDRSP